MPDPPVDELDGPRGGRAGRRRRGAERARDHRARGIGRSAALIGSVIASAVYGLLAVVSGVLSGARIIQFDGPTR